MGPSTIETALLSLEENNRRWQIKGSLIESFYPGPARGNVHAIYILSLDRFLLLDSFDIQVTLCAAKLLSSKMSLMTYILPHHSSMTNLNCLQWSIKQSDSIRLAEIEKPKMMVLDDSSNVVNTDFPTDLDPSLVIEQQRYALFTLRAVYAMRLTDMMLNYNDFGFFLKLFPGAQEKFKHSIDNTKWPGGFQLNIEKILYLSETVEDALKKISMILPPSGYEKKKPYSVSFYDLLGWAPVK